MGLSKKLGGAAQKMGVPASPVVPYKWSNQTYTVAEILKKFKLPCVVQCATDDSCTVVWSDFQFDLRQPLLLYNRRSIQKVHAVSLKQNNDVLEEIGPPLAIPADYEGWFGAAPKGQSKAKRHFRIESIVNSATRRFVVTTKCPAFTTSHGPGGSHQYKPHDIMPGEILRRVCVMDSDPDDPDCPDLVKQHGPCLECLDEKDEDVVIPLSYATLSYEVEDTYPDEESRVFQIPSLVGAGNTKLPRILTLIHGDLPLLAYAFTGMIRCYSVFKEETILAATLEDPGSRCLELVTDSCVRFRLGLNETAVKKTCEYACAFQMCANFGAKFVTKIKVSFTLKPELADTGVVDLSTSESTSDMQDVEANSEFEITWGSVKKARLHMAASCSQPDASSEVAAAEAVIETTVPNKTDSVSEDPSSVYGKISETELPQYRDFTEQEIVKLMLKKGMMDSTDIVDDVPVEEKVNKASVEHEVNEASVEHEVNEASVELEGGDPPLEVGPLHDNRVTDNPLFYFFQRNPQQNPWKPAEPADEEPSESEDEDPSDDSHEENVNMQNQNGHENPLGYLFTQRPLAASSQAETRNPLSYLFEPMSGQIFTDKESRVNKPADKNKDDYSVSSHFQHSVSAVESGSELIHYKQVACRTARAYSGNDEDDDDEGEEEDYCSESDNSAEMSESSSIDKELYHNEGIDLPITTNLIDTGYFQMRKNPNIENRGHNTIGSGSKDTNGASLKCVHKTTITAAHDDNMSGGSSDLNVSNEETEAVNDLFTLVDMEASKDFSNNASENSKWLPKHDGFTSGLNASRQGKTVGGGTVRRLNTLLEQVSEIVSTSSDRILDSNKDLRNIHQDSVISGHTTRQKEASSIPETTTNENTVTGSCEMYTDTSILGKSSHTESVINENTVTGSCEMYTDTSILGKSSHTQSVIDDDNSLIMIPSERRLDATVFKRDDLMSRFHDRYNQEFNTSKSESSPSVLRRTNMQGNLSQLDQERINHSKSGKVHNAKTHEPSLSSIFSVIQRQRNSSDLSETNSQRDDHSHRDHTEIEDYENESASSTTLSSERNYTFPYKNQRVLSLTKGNILTSLQNHDRLNSSNDSLSSNRSSSSPDNSFIRCTQGVPRLVVIGDNDLIVQGNLHDNDRRDHNMIYLQQQYYGYPYQLRLGEINAADSSKEVFEAQERYAVSKSGKFRSNTLTRPQASILQMENDEEFLHEDYV